VRSGHRGGQKPPACVSATSFPRGETLGTRLAYQATIQLLLEKFQKHFTNRNSKLSKFTIPCSLSQSMQKMFDLIWTGNFYFWIFLPGRKCALIILTAETLFSELRDVLHTCNTLNSEMIHFINQMQYYITFEVSSSPLVVSSHQSCKKAARMWV
jgi:hypothetical protein